jgi:hypothetical protein
MNDSSSSVFALISLTAVHSVQQILFFSHNNPYLKEGVLWKWVCYIKTLLRAMKYAKGIMKLRCIHCRQWKENGISLST